jgi:hypothetical protein
MLTYLLIYLGSTLAEKQKSLEKLMALFHTWKDQHIKETREMFKEIETFQANHPCSALDFKP